LFSDLPTGIRPDFNPIEEAFSKIKAFRKATAARTHEALHTAIVQAIHSVTPTNLLGWFNYCGYPLPEPL